MNDWKYWKAIAMFFLIWNPICYSGLFLFLNFIDLRQFWVPRMHVFRENCIKRISKRKCRMPQKKESSSLYCTVHSNSVNRSTFDVLFSPVHFISHQFWQCAESNCTVEPSNSGKFGHPEFFRYCEVFRYFAGSIAKKWRFGHSKFVRWSGVLRYFAVRYCGVLQFFFFLTELK